MRVIMNGIAALKPKTGVGHYVARLHQELGHGVQLYPGTQWTPFVRHAHRSLSSAARGDTASASFARRVSTLLRSTLKHSAKIAVERHFAHTCKAGRYTLYHEPNFIPFTTDLPTIVTVHDLSVLLHPEWHPQDRVQHHERHFERAIRRAQHLITVSEEVGREVQAHLGIPEHKITAVLNGVGSEFHPMDASELSASRQHLQLPERYFLTVGTIEPRKNLLTVLKAYADLPDSVRNRCPLVHAGPWGWKSEPEREFFAVNARKVGIRHLGYVAARDLPALYSGAEALLFPSFYEGFGLPPLEMLACGGAVVCSNSARAVQEVMGQKAIYLDPRDVTAWRTIMKWLVHDPGFKCEIRRGGVEHAARMTWKRTAHETIDVYRKTLGLPACTRSESKRFAA